ALDQCLARESIFPRIRRLGGGARGEAPGVPVPRATSATMAERTLGVIGGSGRFELPRLRAFERPAVRTPCRSATPGGPRVAFPATSRSRSPPAALRAAVSRERLGTQVARGGLPARRQ